ncbi:MAG TPA: hypothetical protein VGM90_18140 [Kofleriaceae bacterium]|jgi:hypothetical protein
MRWVPFLPAVAAFIAVAAVGDAAPRNKGRVVRIERQRAATEIPRICEVRDSGEGACFGPEPRMGDVITVVGEQSVLAEARVTHTEVYGKGAQACAGLWSIQVDVVKGDLDNSMHAIGVVAGDVHPHNARVVARDRMPRSLPGVDTDSVQVAIDRDGDGNVDLFLSQSSCDANHPDTSSCLDEWAMQRGRFERVFQTNFAACGL